MLCDAPCSALQAQLQSRQAEVKKLKLAKAAANAKALTVAISDRTEEEADIESPDQKLQKSMPFPQQSVKAPPLPTAPLLPTLPPEKPPGPTHILFLPPHVVTRPGFFK